MEPLPLGDNTAAIIGSLLDKLSRARVEELSLATLAFGWAVIHYEGVGKPSQKPVSTQ